MKCKKCQIRIKTPSGKTRDTQVCGKCRGVLRGRPTSRYDSK